MKPNKACEHASVQNNCDTCEVKDTSLFCSNPDVFMEVEKHRADCRFKAGQTIFYADNEPLGIFTIRRGLVKLEVISESGAAHTVRLVGPGGTLGYRSLFSNESYHATAVCVENTDLCFIPKSVVLGLFQQHPEIAMKLLSHLSKDLRVAEEKWMDQMDKGASERIADALLFLQDHFVHQDWTRREIAEWAGTTPETVIRTLSHFEREGLIDQKEGRAIRLLKKEKLKEFASLQPQKNSK